VTTNLVSIIITHYNYSHMLAGALEALAGQTHAAWECVVVDDCSNDDQREAAADITAKYEELGRGVSFLALTENIGQVPAFFAGLDKTSGEFVCLLDPDDRYAPTFLERLLAAHLNETVFAPLACCDQRIVRPSGEVISGIYSPLPLEMLGARKAEWTEIPERPADQLFYVAHHASGWHWTSTSAMMFRRPALELLRPHKRLSYGKAADSYLASGAHSLGGTLRLTAPLIDRMAHANNSWLIEGVFASTQNKRRPGGTEVGHLARADVAEAIRANGGGHYLGRTKSGRKPLFRRLGHSIAKRARRLAGLQPVAKHGGA
jgi:glycosyltransferase involved in cell wall biosynthesis